MAVMIMKIIPIIQSVVWLAEVTLIWLVLAPDRFLRILSNVHAKGIRLSTLDFYRF